MPIDQIKVLDCTVRDGGYINNWDFSREMVNDIYQQLSKAGVDIVELGFRDNSQSSPLWRRCPDELISEIKGSTHGAQISVMVDFGKATAADFLEKSESPIDMIRVAVHKNKIAKALALIDKIKQKGYFTSIQLMGYPQFNKDEKKTTLEMLLDCPPDCVYIADSYGSLFPNEVRGLLEPIVDANKFKVGFHPHNNLQLAFANTMEAIKAGVDIVDSTLYGIGRGAGNLATETILAYLQKLTAEKYNVIYALLCVDMYLLELKENYEWGYRLPYMLSAFAECHPYYSKTMVEARRYTIDDVWRALNLITKEEPVGFDSSLLEKILDSGLFEHQSRIDFSENDIDQSQPVIPESPDYYQRHKGETFLILANGKNLLKYKEQIDIFIDKYNPVIMGANNLRGLFAPDYHAFMNKRRFVKYVNGVENHSKILLSYYFPQDFIRQYTDREYERIVFELGDRNELNIVDGVVSNDCTSVSMLLIAVAYVMGAKEIFVAGMDGFVKNDSLNGRYFYQEPDDTKSDEFNMTRHMWSLKTLDNLDCFLRKNGVSGVNIITPTSYEKYYRGIKNFI